MMTSLNTYITIHYDTGETMFNSVLLIFVLAQLLVLSLTRFYLVLIIFSSV